MPGLTSTVGMDRTTGTDSYLICVGANGKPL